MSRLEVTEILESVSEQENVEWKQESSYLARAFARNESGDHVLREALSAQIARRLRAAASSSDDRSSAFLLRLEHRERVLHQEILDSGKTESVADSGVPRSARGEGAGPRLGETRVVEKAGASEGLERLVASDLAEAFRA